MIDELDDVGDEAQVRPRKRKLEWEREQELQDIRDLCDSSPNLVFLWRLLAACGMFRSSSWKDPMDMAIASGKRDIGLWLIAELEEASPDIYVRMKQAAQIRKERMNERRGNSSYS